MAVEVVYRSSRDPERLFMDKAEADRYDKMLELAERLSEVLHKACRRSARNRVKSWASSWPRTARSSITDCP